MKMHITLDYTLSTTGAPEAFLSNISPTFSYVNILSETKEEISVYRNIH